MNINHFSWWRRIRNYTRNFGLLHCSLKIREDLNIDVNVGLGGESWHQWLFIHSNVIQYLRAWLLSSDYLFRDLTMLVSCLILLRLRAMLWIRFNVLSPSSVGRTCLNLQRIVRILKELDSIVSKSYDNWFRTDRTWTWILTIKIFSSSTPSSTVRDLAAAQQLIHQMPASPQLFLNLLQLILNTIFKFSFVTNLFIIDVILHLWFIFSDLIFKTS